MIVRRNNKLASLPPEDRSKLDAWLQSRPYRVVLQLAAAPRPEGLALTTNLRALSAYFNKFLAPDPCAQLADLALHNPDAAEAAAINLLQVQALHGAATPDETFNPRKFSALVRFNEQLQTKKYRQQLMDYRHRAAEFRALRFQQLEPQT